MKYMENKTMKNIEAYLYGMVLGTHSFLMMDDFLKPDVYSEIKEQYFLPGGETGTAATVLESLGVSVRIDGTWIGREVAPLLRNFYAEKNVDLSSLKFTDDAGVMDYVVITGIVRTPMGHFQKLSAVDPYFGEQSIKAAELCVKHGIPYVTIDSKHDSYFHKHAAINVVSKECYSEKYADESAETVMKLMMQETDGLTILTQGGGEMLYGRRGEEIHRMKPFDVTVRSTLGAGDTFKAGCVYALLNGYSDEETVRFASACSGIAISRFPLPLNPPRLDEVKALIENSL